MAYVPNFEWDLFISYAHDDNIEVGPARLWVSKFHERLVPAVQKNLDGELKVFFAERTQPMFNTIENILTEVERSALFLVIGSPNWVRSSWCKRELDKFVTCNRGDTTRVFIAEFEPPRGDFSYPKWVPDNLRVGFWKEAGPRKLPMTVKSGAPLFEERFLQVVSDLCTRARTLRSDKPDGPDPSGERKVFLAYSTPDVSEEREELFNYLNGAKVVGTTIRVVPREEMPRDPQALTELLDEQLSQSSMFVHCLGLKKMKPLDPSSDSPTLVQAQAADRHKHLEVFRWRPEGIDPTLIKDDSYQPLLDSAQVGSPTALGQEIVLRLEAIIRDEGQPPPGGDPTVLNLLVSAGSLDRADGQKLVAACKSETLSGKVEAVLDSFDNDVLAETAWASANAVAFVQGEADPQSLIARFVTFRRARDRMARKAVLKRHAFVFTPPPSNKAKDMVARDDLDEIDISVKWNVEPFCQWVHRVAGANEGSS